MESGCLNIFLVVRTALPGLIIRVKKLKGGEDLEGRRGTEKGAGERQILKCFSCFAQREKLSYAIIFTQI